MIDLNLWPEATLPATLRKFGLLHGIVWTARLEAARTFYLYLAPAPLNALAFSESSPGEEYPEDMAQLGTYVESLKGAVLKKIVFRKETSVVSLYFSDGRILHLHCAGGHATLVDKFGHILVSSSKRLQADEDYTPPPDRSSAYEWAETSPEELKEWGEAHERDTLRAALEKSLAKELGKEERKLANVRLDLEKASRYELYVNMGELLKINYHLIAPRKESLTVKNVFLPDEPEIEIKLLKDKSPAENVSHYFKLAEKARNGRELLERRAEACAAETARLRKLQDDLGELTIPEMKALAEELEGRKPVKQRPPALRKKDPGPGSRYKIYSCRSSDGFAIIIGRSAKDNDYVTMRLANGNDGWLHVRDYPGSHCIIRAEKKREISQTAWREAAEMCAALSQAPDLSLVDVIYTYKKFVSKPRHAKPGSVLVAGGKNITVRKDQRQNKLWRESHFANDGENFPD
jgi:predicted ribosome quality control (RQC) complex YloA/Tae2 family protein